jgi:hypothetical protein
MRFKKKKLLSLNSLANSASRSEGIAGKSLLPPKTDPYARALVRSQADHISRTLVPAFYRFLQAQDPRAQASGAQEFARALDHLASLLERAERELPAMRKRGPGSGLWFEDGELNWTDVIAGPCESFFLFFLSPFFGCTVWDSCGSY